MFKESMINAPTCLQTNILSCRYRSAPILENFSVNVFTPSYHNDKINHIVPHSPSHHIWSLLWCIRHELIFNWVNLINAVE